MEQKSLILFGLKLATPSLILLILLLSITPIAGEQSFPTPTLFSIEESVLYSLETIEDNADKRVFPGMTRNGIIIGDTVVQSLFPDGLNFSVHIEAEHSEVETVNLVVKSISHLPFTYPGSWDAESDTWKARLGSDRGYYTAWIPIDFAWQVSNASGETVETPLQRIEYWDPHHAWFRMENAYEILYWYGFGADDPDVVAREATDLLAITHPRRVQGFGQALNYKPVVVIYPDAEAFYAAVGDDPRVQNTGGGAVGELGYVVQWLPPRELPERARNCPWYNTITTQTMPMRISAALRVTTHEYVHLLQDNILIDPQQPQWWLDINWGPGWWQEGQATWFAAFEERYSYDARLRALGQLEQIPSLTSDIPGMTLQADGCPALAYDVGASFVNWLVAIYGLDAHRQIVEHMHNEVDIFEAVEQVTATSFAEIENNWRSYLDLPPVESPVPQHH